jgi:hypothetical protein
LDRFPAFPRELLLDHSPRHARVVVARNALDVMLLDQVNALARRRVEADDIAQAENLLDVALRVDEVQNHFERRRVCMNVGNEREFHGVA